MPGHNGKLNFASMNIDVTELPNLDNMLSSEGIILEAENELAKVYKKRYALFSTSGSTNFMFVSLALAKNDNLKVIAFSDMHVSFYNAIKILNMSYETVEGFDELKDKLEKSQSKCAIFTTSPNYFGQIKDLNMMRNLAHLNNSILVVDSAHGAHFAYSDILPNCASNFADITFYSMHKTMPTLTGGAVLVVDDERLYNLAKYFRSKLHSTSPNYMVMASMDYARDEFLKIASSSYLKIKQKIESFNGEIAGFKIIQNDDFTRLVLKMEGCDAYDVLKQLSKMGIDIEMAYLDMLVLIITPYNYADLDMLEDYLKKVEPKQLKIKKVDTKAKKKVVKNAVIDFMDIDKAEGCVAASEVGIYPPSVPIVKEMEIIDKSIIEILLTNKEHLFGLVNGKIAVLK